MGQFFYYISNKLVVTLFISLIISLNCYADISFPITSKIALDYYTKDPNPNTFEFYIYPKLQINNLTNFNDQEALIPIKGEYFSYNTVNTNLRYLTIASFSKNGYQYKIIIYNRFGEGDSFYLNIQLNSYDKSNNLVDSLLLDSRYSFEEIEAFRDFSIQVDGTINIDYKRIRLYDENENGELYKIEKPTVKSFAKEIYKIEKGTFKLISRKGERP